jgi:histidinol-phosphate/aromatic aminotransferase/cobyric acid decarboxylase-like protein/imidazoleglycerol phosphate dehydratase HisB
MKMKELPAEFKAYTWAPPNDEVARLAGIDPSQVVRYDQNTPPLPLPSTRPGTIAATLARVSSYPPGGYDELREAIARYNGVSPDNVVLGVGADDLILLCARCFAGAGDTIAIPEAPTYPVYRIAAQLARADVGDDDPVVTFTCRPNSPDGAVRPLPDARPLVVDEAYFEYFGETAVPLLDDEVIVLRTFSKAFGLAGARIGYALAAEDVAAELNARQAPAPVSSLAAALAVAALASPPDVTPVVEERERLAAALRAIGLPPLPSEANFLFVPYADGRELASRLLHQGLVVRAYDNGIRITIRDRVDDDLVVETLARLLDRPSSVPAPAGRSARHLRATAETRIAVRLGLDGASRVMVNTGAGIYDHFLEQLAFHAGLDLVVEGAGDLETGDHHTVEDTALAFGEALDRALGDRRGIARYGDATVPMDDALARAAVDLGGRPYAELSLEPEPGMAGHFFGSLAQAGRMAIHVEASGRDAHHTAEAAYKAVGRALKTALRVESSGIPSTKGKL